MKRVAVLDVGCGLLVSGEGVEHRALDLVEADAREDLIECLGADDSGHERLDGLVLDQCELHHADQIWNVLPDTRCAGTIAALVGFTALSCCRFSPRAWRSAAGPACVPEVSSSAAPAASLP